MQIAAKFKFSISQQFNMVLKWGPGNLGNRRRDQIMVAIAT